ncbi:unnamed protein product [Adineta ricciae]|uniref:Ig-like domain-containing protein n=1 Tax=Adineta ricciae TaxID=249248 RepID=A0A815DPD5_ADIRI|nr:unnamed protein product [Adineta ricciae]CAF1678323.1 unnamed protein product [Adineta ricciae]
MFSIAIIFVTLLIPSIQSSKPTLKLTFTPDERYYKSGNQVEILCELINPTDHTESPQLWHVDLKTGKHTPISRSLLNRPTEDSLDYFKQIKQNRLEYVKKNHLRIRQILNEDTARYECNCPDCEESLGKQAKDFQVVQTSDPKWLVEPGWPIQEHATTTIKCTADHFYPYVSHKILRNHHDITSKGKATLPTTNTFPQVFSWEDSVTPTADWHNTTLRCTVTQGNHEQHAIKVLEVIFTPRFLTCSDKQTVNSSKEKSTIECSYAGNPKPTLTWVRQTDDKSITTDAGITIKEIDEHHGKYKSIVTFERDKLIAIPLTTTTRAPGAPTDATPQAKVVADNYYQQLLNGGFIAKLSIGNEQKAAQKIHIVKDASQARSNSLGGSAQRLVQNFSTSMVIVLLFTILRYMMQNN